MFQIVEARHGRGHVVLGKDITCPTSEHRGWGKGCQLLVLKSDGLYHCGDCGLVYGKPERYEKLEKTTPTAECECAQLEEVIEWWFDENFGYDCPVLRYHCTVCGRHYKTPPLADAEKQDSEGAKEYIISQVRFRQQEYAEKRSGIQDDILRVAQALEEVTPEERQELLKPLFS